MPAATLLVSRAAATEPRAAATGVDDDRPLTATPLAALPLPGPWQVGAGAMLSVGADAPVAPPAAAQVAPGDAGVALEAALTPRWRAALQADALLSPALLDAHTTLSTAIGAIRVGRFKVPVSGEALLPDADPPLQARARAIDALAPGRGAGVELSRRWAEDRVYARAGAFGGAPEPGAAGRQTLGAARVGLALPVPRGAVEVAASGAWGSHRGVALAATGPRFTGERAVGGADAQVRGGRWSLSGEVLVAALRPTGAARLGAGGGHLTATVDPLPWLQALTRLDRYRPPGEDPSHLLIPSLAVTHPALPAVQPQIDLVVPLDGPEPVRLVASVAIVAAAWGAPGEGAARDATRGD